MPFSSMLCHWAFVQQAVATTDRFNQPQTTFEEQPNPFPCRLVPIAGSERNTVGSEDDIVAVYTVYLPPDAPVTERDRLRVVDALGSPLATNVDITFLKKRYQGSKLHHYEAGAKEYR